MGDLVSITHVGTAHKQQNNRGHYNCSRDSDANEQQTKTHFNSGPTESGRHELLFFISRGCNPRML
jgi:hypothetical protein